MEERMKKCFECEATEDLQEHHVVPKSRGGTKTVYTWEEFNAS